MNSYVQKREFTVSKCSFKSGNFPRCDIRKRCVVVMFHEFLNESETIHNSTHYFTKFVGREEGANVSLGNYFAHGVNVTSLRASITYVLCWVSFQPWLEYL